MTKASTTMTDLEEALADIEDGIGKLRLIDQLGAYDLQNVVDSIRKEHADDKRAEAEAA